MSKAEENQIMFMQSAFTRDNKFISTSGLVDWLGERKSKIKLNVEKASFSELSQWYFCRDLGSLRHKSGKFFSIDGIKVTTNWGTINTWTQPIINQPEIGYLGIITKVFDGVLYFLMQAKVEPGNTNYVQLSPTLQATKSNYTQVHQGKKTPYLEYFQNMHKYQVLLDQLQSEQGARYLRKRNRNIIIKVQEEIPVYDDYRWLTLGQIKHLIQKDNLVNMDTRTVISGIPFGTYDSSVIDVLQIFRNDERNDFNTAMLRSSLDNSHALYNLHNLLSWITQNKVDYDLEIQRIPLQDLDQWTLDDEAIYHVDNKYFKVIGVKVEIEGREVSRWDQPLIEPAHEGICAFIIKKINGVNHFLVQAKLESGNFDILELAPTVQCLTGDYKHSQNGILPFLDYVLESPPERIKYDAMQSEEGGRFYHEQNRNLIIEADDSFPIELPRNYSWMTLSQLQTFLKFNNYLNIQARSLISAVMFN